MSSPSPRRTYIDWARGLAVLVMIEAHTLDAWTRPADKHGLLFRDLTILGGFAAPLFLWLSGVALVLSAARVVDRTGSDRMAFDTVARRATEVFLLAFLFRLQSFVITPGGHPISLFRVDILNVMGPALFAAAAIWFFVSTTTARVVAPAIAATALGLVTPVVRASPLVGALPTWIQWYARPAGEHTVFTLFPWAGFVFAGAAVGALVAAARDEASERRLQLVLGVAGVGLIALGFYTAARPTIYRVSSFWTSSPTWFAIRVGVLMLVLAALKGCATSNVAQRFSPANALARLGRHSLFIYWIHVELVYGYASILWRGRLPLWATGIAYVFFCVLMYGALALRDRVAGGSRGSEREHVRDLGDERAVVERT